MRCPVGGDRSTFGLREGGGALARALSEGFCEWHPWILSLDPSQVMIRLGDEVNIPKHLSHTPQGLEAG
jgi:hypothetical protein